jgi:hypothetical protein
VVEDPLGCYDLSRYDGDQDRMIAELMTFYRPDVSPGATAPS